jgi:hypothetical protein
MSSIGSGFFYGKWLLAGNKFVLPNSELVFSGEKFVLLRNKFVLPK